MNWIEVVILGISIPIALAVLLYALRKSRGMGWFGRAAYLCVYVPAGVVLALVVDAGLASSIDHEFRQCVRCCAGEWRSSLLGLAASRASEDVLGRGELAASFPWAMWYRQQRPEHAHAWLPTDQHRIGWAWEHNPGTTFYFHRTLATITAAELAIPVVECFAQAPTHEFPQRSAALRQRLEPVARSTEHERHVLVQQWLAEQRPAPR